MTAWSDKEKAAKWQKAAELSRDKYRETFIPLITLTAIASILVIAGNERLVYAARAFGVMFIQTIYDAFARLPADILYFSSIFQNAGMDEPAAVWASIGVYIGSVTGILLLVKRRAIKVLADRITDYKDKIYRSEYTNLHKARIATLIGAGLLIGAFIESRAAIPNGLIWYFLIIAFAVGAYWITKRTANAISDDV